MSASDQRETDFYTWAAGQAALLRAGNLSAIDAPNLAAELEDQMGSVQDQLTSRLGVLLAHLLKWQFQPERRGNSWLATIREQRRRVARLLRKNPGLKGALPEAFADAYGDAALIASRETDLPAATFPAECPWSVDQALDDAFWPDAAA